ncbi:MAG: SocA family protein [Lachnospiraceae bacterium]|nr:SocA family protein [Lachnospiraceae bacterium]
MENMLSVAKMFNSLYRAENGVDMDEMRMHKMMYLAQRESLMYNKELLFKDDFEGWMYGPVLVGVRDEYSSGTMFQSAPDNLSAESQKLVKSVYQRYNKLSSWQLSTLSHGELSWKNSREGLSASARGSVHLKLADMRLDAARELLRREVA